MHNDCINTATSNHINNTQKSRKSRLLLKLAQAGILSVALMGAIIGLSPAHKAEAAANNNSLNSMIHQVFGSYGDQAVRVAQCESTMNPGATNSYAIAGSHAAGLFQILHPSTWFTTAEGRAGHSPYDAAANIRAAHEIFVRDGYSWREWQCKP